MSGCISQVRVCGRGQAESGRCGRLRAICQYDVVREGPERLLGIWDLQVTLGEFLDVDILESDYTDILDKTRRAIHVPDPGILHGDLEEHLTVVRGAHIQINGVCEVKPPLGLDYVTK